MRFQPTRREAWLVEIDDAAARTEGDLCARHASDLVLPRGWELHDQRPTPPATPTVATPTVATPTVATPTVATPTVATPTVDELVDARDDLDIDPTEIEIELDEPVVSAPVPRAPRARHTPRSRRPQSVPAPAIGPAPESKDLANLLDAQTPLLRRAFGNIHLDD